MARRKKKKKGDGGPPGAPEWVVTFTDMISLLVTFFVLLMTFSSMDAYDALKVDSWLGGNRGVQKIAGSALPDYSDEDLISATNVMRGANQPHTRPADGLPDDLEEMGQKLTEEHVALDLNDVTDGLVIEFGEEESFDPGSSSIGSSLSKSLREIGRVLENYPHLIVVEGFTDGAFAPSSEYPTAEALSLARARSAARALLSSSKMNPRLLQITGHGSAQPRADDLSVGGRRLNRRVRLRVLSLSRLRSTYLEAHEGER